MDKQSTDGYKYRFSHALIIHTSYLLMYYLLSHSPSLTIILLILHALFCLFNFFFSPIVFYLVHPFYSFNTDNVPEYREDLIFRPKTPPKKRKDGEDLDGYTLVGERTELVKDEDTREYFLMKVRQ